ncbi:hypothetical protein [Caldalkalibacillus mannanilyticus]|uniref:hypothetical protein n=1 Tax=Caldalkalibacillus mannanilyticus TaxID=1418 RepID=UPI000469C85F|nr:hypothetical protein [Caldalkalibacillus mannanilyticus]
MTNIVDGMDAARFKSGNPDYKKAEQRRKEERNQEPLCLKILRTDHKGWIISWLRVQLALFFLW